MKIILTFRVINSSDVKDDFEWHFEDAPPALKPGDFVVTSDASKSLIPVFEIHGSRTIRTEGATLFIHHLVRRVEDAVKGSIATKKKSAVVHRDPVE